MGETSLGSLGEAKVLIKVDWKSLDGELKKVESKFSDKLGKIGSSMTKIGKTMTAGITVPFVIGMKKAVDAAGDLTEATSAIETVFGDASDIIEDFADNSAQAVGLSALEFKQLSTVTGSFLQNLGYSAEEAADETIILTERASDMAAVFNTDVSQALQAIQSGLKGEFNPLEQFGVKINAAAIENKALAMGLADTKAELDDNAKAQAALALVMEQTERISGTFAEESEGLAGQLKLAKAEFRNAATTLGTMLLPAVTKVVTKFTELVTTFNAMDEGKQKSILVFAGITAAIGPLLIAGGKLLIFLPKAIDGFKKLKLAADAANTSIGGATVELGMVVFVFLEIIKGARESRKEIIETTAAAKDYEDTLVSSTDSYEDYLAAVKDANAALDNRNDSLKKSATIGGKHLDQIQDAAVNVVVLSEAEWEAAKATEAMGDATEDATWKLAELNETGKQWSGSGWLSGNTDAGEWGLAARMEEARKKMSDYYTTIIGLTKNYSSVLQEIQDKYNRIHELNQIADTGGYIDGVWMSAKDAQAEVELLTGEIGELRAEISLMANQVVFDMAMAEVAVDGITRAEYESIMELGVELGLFSKNAADTAITEFDRALGYWENIKFQDKSVSINVGINGYGSGSAFVNGITIDLTNTNEQRAAGGLQSAYSPTVVGERGPELWIPHYAGSIIANSELRRSAENGSGGQAGNMTAELIAALNRLPDEKSMGRMLRDAVLMAIG